MVFGLLSALVMVTGCEWSGGAGVETWSDSQNFADFSGSYSAADGGVLVRQFRVNTSGTTNLVTTTTNTVMSTNVVNGEYMGQGDGSSTVFNGALSHGTIIAGTVNIAVGGYLFRDQVGGVGNVTLTVTPNDGTRGALNYNTRAFSLSFPAPISAGSQILASYIYLDLQTEVMTTDNAPPGNHGTPIYTFVVYQQGNKIQITDSNGTTYEGAMGTMRTTGGTPVDLSSGAAAPTTGTVEAQFSATGVSQGYKVTIVGVLQGTLSGNSMTARNMQATFIEEGGNQAAIGATAR